ncbi:MAG TPA: tetratricopeptide repeat protein [Phycisphaerae bacterium]|nr:tetratricopeptide repeat protein [Phycisphaerae bacterium]
MEWVRIFKSSGAIAATVVMLSFLTGCETTLQKFRREGVDSYKAQNYDQSLAYLNKALHEDQFDAVSNTYAGLNYYHNEQYVQAAYHFNVALNADPSSEEAKAGLTATLIKQGKPDEALDALERAAKLAEKVQDPREQKSTPKRPYKYQTEERMFLGKGGDCVRIARTYEKLGDYDNALVYYKKALEREPGNANVLMSIADLAERAGNKPLAQEYLKRAYSADPSLPGLTQAMTRNGVAISDVIH